MSLSRFLGGCAAPARKPLSASSQTRPHTKAGPHAQSSTPRHVHASGWAGQVQLCLPMSSGWAPRVAMGPRPTPQENTARGPGWGISAEKQPLCRPWFPCQCLAASGQGAGFVLGRELSLLSQHCLGAAVLGGEVSKVPGPGAVACAGFRVGPSRLLLRAGSRADGWIQE